MKVLHLVGFYPDYGGPYTVVKGLTKALAEFGCEIGVCSPLPHNYDRSKLDAFDHLRDIVYLESSNDLLGYLWPSYSKDWGKVLKKLNDYELLHIHGFFDYYAYFVYRHLKKPYIITPHGTLQKEAVSRKSYLKKTLYLSLIGRRTLRNSRAIHALTVYEEACLRDLGVDQQSISVVPNGISPEDFCNLPDKGLLFRKYPELEGKRIVLFMSRINWKKGLDDLIPAFSSVVEEIGNAHLVLIGPDSEGYMNKVDVWIRDYGLNEHVSYMGPVFGKDRLMFLQDSNMLVLPSYSEAFPMTIIEAMYMNLSVIITEDSGIADIVRDNNVGLVINKNRNEIATAIIKLLKDDALARELGRNGGKLVREKYTWDKVADRMMRVYAEVLGKETRGVKGWANRERRDNLIA